MHHAASDMKCVTTLIITIMTLHAEFEVPCDWYDLQEAIGCCGGHHTMVPVLLFEAQLDLRTQFPIHQMSSCIFCIG